MEDLETSVQLQALGFSESGVSVLHCCQGQNLMVMRLICLQITADNILPFKVDEENLVLLSLRHISQALPHSSAYFRISDIKAASKQSTVYITLRVNRQVAKRNMGRSNKEFHEVRDSIQSVFACMLKFHNVGALHVAVWETALVSAGAVPLPACAVLQER